MIATVKAISSTKTVRITYVCWKLHKLLKRKFKQVKEKLAHDEHSSAKVGDLVKLVRRKISKTKSLCIIKVLKHAN